MDSGGVQTPAGASRPHPGRRGAGRGAPAPLASRAGEGDNPRMLDRLESKGLLMRSRSATDRRVVELTLTDQGRELTRQIPHHLAAVYNAGLAGFSQEEFVTLKNMLRRIIANRDISA